MKFASLFTGMGAVDIGAMQAGLTPIWGVEIDSNIVDVAHKNLRFQANRINGYRTHRNDIQFVNFEAEERPDWLHASPPCINASRAKSGKETQYDVELADAICRAIAVLKPDYFSLENVMSYAQFNSFSIIKDELRRLNYCYDIKVFDCADHGVPQSRKRLFLVASKSIVSLDNVNTSNLFSWQKAIADLIPTLKPTILTEWQKEAIRKQFNATGALQHFLLKDLPNFVIQRSGARKKDGIPNNTIRMANEPMFTVKAMSGKVRVSPKQATIVIDGQPYEADTRCLARWQSIPDWYQFSGDLKLDTKMIGNAVPPLMMQKIIEAVLK